MSIDTPTIPTRKTHTPKETDTTPKNLTVPIVTTTRELTVIPEPTVVTSTPADTLTIATRRTLTPKEEDTTPKNPTVLIVTLTRELTETNS